MIFIKIRLCRLYIVSTGKKFIVFAYLKLGNGTKWYMWKKLHCSSNIEEVGEGEGERIGQKKNEIVQVRGNENWTKEEGENFHFGFKCLILFLKLIVKIINHSIYIIGGTI